MSTREIRNINSIREFHQLRGMQQPDHPMISVIDYSEVKNLAEHNDVSWRLNFYLIGIKRDLDSYLKYGQQEYDFENGVMSFMAPGQVLNITVDAHSNKRPSGTIILVHADFLWNHPLAKEIKKHSYFGYGTNEALFLSEKEELLVNNIMQLIANEYHNNLDTFSEGIIVAHLETLLSYADRFYNRQFLTRKKKNSEILDRLEELLETYFSKKDITEKRLPTVKFIADSLFVSPDYLSAMLRVLTGRTAQQHIHDKLIDKAKERLGATSLSISEIAYELGFEHVQSFSKLFRQKTQLSPLEFRKSFN